MPPVAALLQTYENEFKAVEGQLDAKRAQINSNPAWSAEGRAKALKTAETDFLPKLEAVRAEAVRDFNRDAKDAGDKAREILATEAEAERKLVGDVVFADFLRRDVEAISDPEQLQRAFDEAPSDFSRRVIGRAVLHQLRGEAAQQNPTAAEAVRVYIQGVLSPSSNTVAQLKQKAAHYAQASSEAAWRLAPDTLTPSEREANASALTRGF